MTAMHPMSRRTFVAAMGAASLLPGSLRADQYPSKTIRLVASYPPGGGTDFMARLIAERLQAKWGQPVVVDNRAGGLGVIGAQAAATAKPDGYTLYVGSSDLFVLLPLQYQNLPLDPAASFIPIAPIANQYQVVVVHPSVPVNSLQELVALAKSRPGQMNFASQGTATLGHLAGELFQARTGTKMTHIAYKGTAPAVTELLSGQGPTVMFGMMGTVAAYVKAGKLRALAVTSPGHSLVLPQVPSAAEAGLRDFVLGAWNGVFAPAGTPAAIVDQLNAAIREALQMPEAADRLTKAGFEPVIATPAEFTALIKSDQQKWSQVVRDAGIQKQTL
ncbi:MAG: Tricarboxylate transport protein TctC [Ramlibacter sp.]|nr:Tricarboxylate transport protein TctC [Ramlibacter sp.]